MVAEYKILLVGYPSYPYKTTKFLRSLMKEEAVLVEEKSRSVHDGVRVRPFIVKTQDHGPIKFHVWEVSEEASVDDYKNEGFHCAVITCDLENEYSCKVGLRQWQDTVSQVCGESCPIYIVVSNKDTISRKVSHCELMEAIWSSKDVSWMTVKKPDYASLILRIARKLHGANNLLFLGDNKQKALNTPSSDDFLRLEKKVDSLAAEVKRLTTGVAVLGAIVIVILLMDRSK